MDDRDEAMVFVLEILFLALFVISSIVALIISVAPAPWSVL